MPYYVIIFRLRFVLSSIGYRQGTERCFALTEIRTNQQTTNQRKLSHTKSSFGLDQMERKQTNKPNRFVLTDIPTNRHYTSRRLQYFGSDSYHPALGCCQEARRFFALTDIRTNQHRTNRLKLSHKERLWPGQTNKRKRKKKTDSY